MQRPGPEAISYTRPDAFKVPDPFPYKPNNLTQVRGTIGRVIANVDTVFAETAAPAMPTTSTISEKRLGEVVSEALRKERPSRPEGRKTADWIRFFNNNWQQEGLPQDWYNLRAKNQDKVGFMMNRELDMLEDPYNKDHVAEWVQRVKRDLEGFKLEFLTDKIVYPREYTWSETDPTRLEDRLYGKAKDGVKFVDITETISEDERYGSVKLVAQREKEFLQTAPEGAITIMTSPLGETGLRTDDGELVVYPDSYFFVKKKLKGGKVMNYTLKTDLPLEACRKALLEFTGIDLPADAPIDWYVHTLATINPGEHNTIHSVEDVIDVLAKIRPERAFFDKQNGLLSSWQDMKTQVGQGEKLYNFDKTTKDIIDEIVDFSLEGFHSKQTWREGIAASILEMTDVFDLETEVAKLEKQMQAGEVYDLRHMVQSITQKTKSFGDILAMAAARIGCAGGGPALIVQTMSGARIVIRVGGITRPGEDAAGGLIFKCTKGHTNTRNPLALSATCRYPGCEAAMC